MTAVETKAKDNIDTFHRKILSNIFQSEVVLIMDGDGE